MKEVSIPRLQIAFIRDFCIWGFDFQGKVKVIIMVAFNLTVNKKKG